MGLILSIVVIFVIVLVGWSVLVAASDADDQMGYP